MADFREKWDIELEYIDGADNVYIFTHANPDGDAIASGTSLCLALQKCGKNAKLVLQEKVPTIYDHLMIGNIVYVENLFTCPVTDKTVAISVDSSTLERLGDKLYPVFQKMPHRVTIDHHLGEKNEDFTDADFTDSKWAATCEGLYLLIKQMLDRKAIAFDSEIAIRLYTGILTDTGRFVYSNTTGNTLRVVGALLDLTETNLTYISKIHYDYKSLACQKIVARSISRMEAFDDGRVVFSFVDDEDFKITGGEISDASSISSELINTIGAKIAVFIRPTEIIDNVDKSAPRSWKISLRSVPEEDVSVICGKFGGGGHKNASGATIIGTLCDVKSKILGACGVTSLTK